MRRQLVVLFVAVGALLLGATPALAHVRVTPSSAAKGGYAKLTFRVPNESDTASTTKVEVFFPEGVTFESVSTKPLPGWTAAVAGDKSNVNWTGGKIAPGEFQEFDISIGPLPDEGDSLTFKTVQTYDDGEVSRWIDDTPASGEEPEHPAPVVGLTAATDEHDAAATDEAAGETDLSDASSSDGVARGLGGVAIVVGLAGVALALRRSKAMATN